MMMTLVMTSMTNMVLLLVGTASDGADEDSAYISPNRKFTVMVPRTCDDGTSSYSSSYDTGWLSCSTYRLLLLGSGLANSTRRSCMGFTLPCLYYRIGFVTSNFRLPQGPCHAKDSHDTCCCSSGCWAVPWLRW